MSITLPTKKKKWATPSPDPVEQPKRTRKPKKATSRVEQLRDLAVEFATQPRVFEFDHRTIRIAAPLQITSAGIFCWFVLGPVSWQFKTRDEREGTWDQQRSRFGQLAEDTPMGYRPLQIRKTTLPFGFYEWAARLNAATPNPLPAVEGCENWNTTLGHAQVQLASESLDRRFSAVGVWIAPTPTREVLADLTAGDAHPRTKAVKTVVNKMAKMARLFEGAGLNGRFATAADMAFLMHRSLSMGLPLPKNVLGEQWGSDELGEFFDRRAWHTPPASTAVEVSGVGPDGRSQSSWVVPLAMGMMPKMTWPNVGVDPWGVLMDRAGPGELAINGAIFPGSAMVKNATLMVNAAKANEDHYVSDHGEDPPPDTAEVIADAKRILVEVGSGDNRIGPRFAGTICIAATGDTLEAARDMADALKTDYKDLLHMPLSEVRNPAEFLRSFVPGEPRVAKGWTRYLSMGYLAACMPNIGDEVGTRTGFYLGYSMLTKRPVIFDPHYGPEKLNKSGLFLVYGGPGAGKSSLLWHLIYWMTLSGEWTMAFDPSGPMRDILKLPELAPFGTEFNLSRANEGTLAPFGLIPIPREENYVYDTGLDIEEFNRDTKFSRLERHSLAVDTFRMQLTHATLQRPGVDSMLSTAVRAMADHEMAGMVPVTMWNPRWAIDALNRMPGGEEIARELHDASDSPYGALIIPSHSRPIEAADVAEKRLTVITMPGLTPPNAESDPSSWGPTQRLSVAPLHLATFLATRFVYEKPKDDRKNLLMDEQRIMNRFASGVALMDRTTHDSRKFDLAMFLASQHPKDHQTGSIAALKAGVFAGNLPDEAAEDGCKVLGIENAHAGLFPKMRPGEMIFRDSGTEENPEGRLALIKNDIDWHPSLAASRTTPGIARPEWSGELAPTPHIDPRLMEVLS